MEELGAKVPGVHSVHRACPSWGFSKPGLQLLHVVLPVNSMCSPAGQAVQLADPGGGDCVKNNQNSFNRSCDWFSANQGPVFPGPVGS